MAKSAIGPFLDGPRGLEDTARHLEVSSETARLLHDQWTDAGWIEADPESGKFFITDYGRSAVFAAR